MTLHMLHVPGKYGTEKGNDLIRQKVSTVNILQQSDLYALFFSFKSLQRGYKLEFNERFFCQGQCCGP
jgi:hypothetical protein